MRSKRLVVPAVVVVLLLLAVAGWFLTRPDDNTGSAAKLPATESPASPTGQPGAGTSTTAAPAPKGCAVAGAPFDPTTIKVAGASWPVITPPRDASGVPGIPPLNEAGKHVFAYDLDQGIHPGDTRGNVLLNAHTWPDGSALGNRLLKSLEQGDRIVVRGRSEVLCYHVTKRVEVPAATGLAAYYANNGPPQLAIVVCSGRRLGPGQWENRTIWFASPGV